MSDDDDVDNMLPGENDEEGPASGGDGAFEVGGETCSAIHCRLCLGMLRLPVSTPCGHNFCMECLATHQGAARKAADKTCPACFASLAKLAGDLRVNVQLAALVALVSHLMPAPTTNDAMLTIMSSLHDQTMNKSGVAEAKRVRRVVESSFTNMADLQRLETFSGLLQVRLAEVHRRRALLREGLPADSWATLSAHLCPGEEDVVCEHAVRARARKAFPGLDHGAPHDLIVIPTKTGDFAGDGLQRLMQLPVFGIAAASAAIIVGCQSDDLDELITKVIPAWSANYGAVIAEWITAAQGNGCKTILWVGAYIGQVQSLQARREARSMFLHKAPPIDEDLPLPILNYFTRCFGSYTTCCILGSKQVAPGWKTTEIVPI